MVQVIWLMNKKQYTPLKDITMGILDHCLFMGTGQSVLYKTMIESGLGTAITGEGLSDELLQAMNSICQNILHHENIRAKLQNCANALQREKHWSLADDKTKKDIGAFDWLLSSDHLSGDHYCCNLKDAKIQDFTSNVCKTKNIKFLTAMVFFEKPLGFCMDGVDFTEGCAKYGYLGWAA